MIFRGKYFVSVPKNFVDEPFCVSENFWYRKMFRIRERGEAYRLFVKICLTVPKNFAGEPFSV